MRYESRPQAPPKRGSESPQLLAARAAWYASNPWRPIDWEAVARQQRGASDAMREAQRTQRDAEQALRRHAAAPTHNLRRTAA